jgi:U3 small nucleolar RNA-associated protein 11
VTCSLELLHNQSFQSLEQPTTPTVQLKKTTVMVGLRNSLHRRNHKERAQLVGRKKLGLLEKHKDYVQRAKDYHSKQDRIKRLKVKAAERNKDEFYFAMKSSQTKVSLADWDPCLCLIVISTVEQKGVHVASRGNVALPTDIVKVLKSQDANYIRTMRNAGRKACAGYSPLD